MVTDDKFSPVMSLLIVLRVVVMQYHKVISPSVSTTETVTYPITNVRA